MKFLNMHLKIKYTILGIVLGIGAPATWLTIKIIFFPEPSQLLLSQIASELTNSAANISLYLFMGLGTSLVMGGLGFFIGKSADELGERALELDHLHREVNLQKELFENRYKGDSKISRGDIGRAMYTVLRLSVSRLLFWRAIERYGARAQDIKMR